MSHKAPGRHQCTGLTSPITGRDLGKHMDMLLMLGRGAVKVLRSNDLVADHG